MLRRPALLRLAVAATLAVLLLGAVGWWHAIRTGPPADLPSGARGGAAHRRLPDAVDRRPHVSTERNRGAFDQDDDDGLDDLPTFTILPLRLALQQASDRYRGRVISADLVRPTRAEFSRGVQLVYALRMLTPEHDVLMIRLDARDGAMLEVAGNDLARARRKPGKE